MVGTKGFCSCGDGMWLFESMLHNTYGRADILSVDILSYYLNEMKRNENADLHMILI